MDVSFDLPNVAKRFRERIERGGYDFRDDRVESVLDYLYVAYEDSKGRDPEEITQGFIALDGYMEGISLEHNNEVFALVCNIVSLSEQRAFKDGLQLGAYLILELQGK